MATVEHNLPTVYTPPIGRDDAAAAVRLFLLNQTTPLVTLVGPGGIGKTTLALHLARDILDSFPDGVHFIDLTPLTRPDLIPSYIARAVGVEETAERTTEDALINHYRDRRALLLLDNFEHLLPGAATVGALLRACPSVRVLATSREALRLKVEQVFSLPPLALPDPRSSTAVLAHSPAVELFVRRAQTVRAGFALTVDNAAAVAAIVARLDGLPLAIELAAARVRLFPPKVLLEQLEASPLGLLVGGSRDAPARQQTIRATIAWSYDLLEPADQRLFRRLGVFADGVKLSAIEAVAVSAFADGEIDTLAGLESLLDKSLIIRLPAEDALRFGLLETLRAFAREQLAATGELEVARRAHFDYYLDLAEEAARHYRGPEKNSWLERMTAEENNLLLALNWALEGAVVDRQRATPAIQLAGALDDFWQWRSRPVEALHWLTRALAHCSPLPDAVTPATHNTVAGEARLFTAAGTATWLLGDFAQAAAHHRNALARYRLLSDWPRVAESLNNLAVQLGRIVDIPQAVALYHESLEISLARADWWNAARTVNNLGVIQEELGDDKAAGHYYRDALTYAQRAGDSFTVAVLLNNLALIELRADRLAEAERLLEESLATAQSISVEGQMATCLLSLGEIARRRGDLRQARRFYQDALSLAVDNEYRFYFAGALHALAVLELDAGQPHHAARLLGFAAAFRERRNLPYLEVYSPRGEAGDVAAVRAALGEAAFAASWDQGSRLSRDEVVAMVMAKSTADDRGSDPIRPNAAGAMPPAVGGRRSGVDPLAELTPREREVIRLILRGRTNEAIAKELFVTLKTVEKHAGNALGKLGLRSRAELRTLWEAEGRLEIKD